MSAADDLHKIVEDGMCLGCGLCASISPQMITMARGDDGDLRPFAKDSLPDGDMARINLTCPSMRLEGLPPEHMNSAPHHDTVWGPYHEMSLAHASDDKIRHQASTAGILTTLASYLLTAGLVDGIIHVRAADGSGELEPANFGIATISRTPEDVLAASGSRYGPTAALINIEEVLSSNEKFALVAKPCDLNAIRNLAHLDERVTDRIQYWMTMLCGGFQPDEAFREFLSDHSLSETGLNDVRYRGFGCPGPTSLTYQDGQQTQFHYLDFWGEDESQWSMPLRCKICPDGIGEAADIVAGDAWDGASPDRTESETDPGFNTVITRTKQGAALYDAAIKAGVITKTEEVDCAYMSRVQPHQVTKKLAGQARVEGLREAGSTAPELVNLRAEALSDLLGDEAFNAQKEGAYQRALKARLTKSDIS